MIPPGLLGALFDSVTDDAALPTLMHELSRALGGVSSTLQTYGPDRAEMLGYSGIDETLIPRHIEYYWRVDPWAAGYLALGGRGVVTSDAIISDDDMLRSELYNDLFRGHGDQFRCVAFIEPLSNGDALCFSVHRRRKEPDFGAQAVALAQDLQPLLVKLAQARRRARDGRGRFAERLVDADPDAVALVEGDLRVAFVNAAGRRAFAGGALRIEDGRLASPQPQLARALARAVAAACGGQGGSVLSSGDGALRVAVDPLTGEGGAPGRGAPAIALVRLRDEAARANATLLAAASALALTPAEQLLAGALLRGRSLADHAAARGVSVATARSQMRSLLAKAGASRQAELVLRLKQFAP